MSRYYDWFDAVTPEEYPSPVATDRDADELTPRSQAWSRLDVIAYKTALEGLGLTQEQIDAQIRRDCGEAEPTYLPGFMTRRQA